MESVDWSLPCFTSAEIGEEKQVIMEEYFLARSSMPYRNLEKESQMSLERKVAGTLEQSNGSLRALAPLICAPEAEKNGSSIKRNASIIDGVLDYCKKKSMQSQLQRTKADFPKAHSEEPDKWKQVSKTEIKMRNFGETFAIVSGENIGQEVATRTCVNNSITARNNNPLFCSTPDTRMVTLKNHAEAQVPEVGHQLFEETITKAQQSRIILTQDAGTTFRSSMLIRSKGCVPTHGDILKRGVEKENHRPSPFVVEIVNSNRAPARKPFTTVPTSGDETRVGIQGEPDHLRLHLPSFPSTPKGRMSFQISGSLEWEH